MIAHPPDRADFDWRGFALALRQGQRADGRGLRAIGGGIGVTASDLSRAMGGQMVSVAKVMALCDWLGVDARAFYRPPEKQDTESGCCSGSNVEHHPAASRDSGNAAVTAGEKPS